MQVVWPLTLATLPAGTALQDRLLQGHNTTLSCGHLYILELVEASNSTSLRCRLPTASAKQTAAVQKRIRLRPTAGAGLSSHLLSQPNCQLLSRQHIGTVIMNTPTACTVAGVLAIILCTTGTQTCIFTG